MIDLKGIIFDCDGVIIDSKEANRILYDTVFQKLGRSPLDQDELDFVHSHTFFEAIDYMLPAEKREQAWQIFEEFPYQQLLPYVHLEPGLVEFLKSLHYHSIKSAINTNRSGSMDSVLQNFGLEGLFFPVITSLDVKWPKPHPESLHLILSIWDIPYNQVVFVGDSRVDEQTAQAAGVEFWSYRNESLQAQRYIGDYWSLQQGLFENGIGLAPGKF